MTGDVDSTPAALPAGPPPVRRARWGGGVPWPGRAELRADLPGSLVLVAVLLVAGLWFGLNAPPDYQQGATVKIMFIHVPAAVMAWR